MNLRISDDLALPPDVVTQTVGILAKRRAGKSYTARRIAEQVFKAGSQVVIVDPKGDWWGIRSSADGKKPGLPIVILGGEHADVKLEPGAGELVAKLAVEERVSMLLDVSHFRKKEVATFMTAFLETFYRLKAREEFRTAVLLTVDEADAIAPQKPYPGEERMLGAMEDIIRRGGQRGIGCLMITQRSAVLNKNCLTQCQMLVAMRTIAPQDLAAMKAWIDVHGEPEQRDVLMKSLPSLRTGHAWFWSPGWPTDDGIFQLVTVLPIETFDSGATPKLGEHRVQPKNLADVDLNALEKHMAETIERQKADDPRELKKRIAELERAAKARPAAAAPKPEIKTVDVPILKDAHLSRLEASLSRAEKIAERAAVPIEQLQQVVTNARAAATDIREAIAKAKAPVPLGQSWRTNEEQRRDLSKARPDRGETQADRRPALPDSARRAAAGGEAALPPGEGVTPARQRILNALAFFEGIGIAQVDKAQLALMSDQRPTSGGYFNNLGALRSSGLIAYPTPGAVALTDAGRAIADPGETPDTPEALHALVKAKLPPAKWRILEELIAVYPEMLSKDDLAERSGQKATSGGYFNNLGSLRSLRLIDYPKPGFVVARSILFLEAVQ